MNSNLINSCKRIDYTIDNSAAGISCIVWVWRVFKSEKTHILILNFSITISTFTFKASIDSRTIHTHTPVKTLTRPYDNAPWMILKDVFECFIFDFFRLWVDLFYPILRLSQDSSIRIHYFISVFKSKFLWAICWTSLEKTHTVDCDVSVGDENQTIPSIFSYAPITISDLSESFEKAHWLMTWLFWSLSR